MHVNLFGFGLCVVVVIGICVVVGGVVVGGMFVVVMFGGSTVLIDGGMVGSVGDIVVVELITILYDVLRKLIANSALGYSHLVLLNVFECSICSISVLFCSHKYHNKMLLYLHNIL